MESRIQQVAQYKGGDLLTTNESTRFTEMISGWKDIKIKFLNAQTPVRMISFTFAEVDLISGSEFEATAHVEQAHD